MVKLTIEFNKTQTDNFFKYVIMNQILKYSGNQHIDNE